MSVHEETLLEGRLSLSSFLFLCFICCTIFHPLCCCSLAPLAPLARLPAGSLLTQTLSPPRVPSPLSAPVLPCGAGGGSTDLCGRAQMTSRVGMTTRMERVRRMQGQACVYMHIHGRTLPLRATM
jgi:hypothetical protein